MINKVVKSGLILFLFLFFIGCTQSNESAPADSLFIFEDQTKLVSEWNKHSIAYNYLIDVDAYDDVKIVTQINYLKSIKFPIEVCFTDDMFAQHRKMIKEVASQWQISTTEKWLKFPDRYSSGRCKGGEGIRIDLMRNALYSQIGITNSSSSDKKPTMYLGNLFHGSPKRATQTHYILHEFGHALGFFHEHQRDDMDCMSEIDEEKLKEAFEKYGWDEDKIKANMKLMFELNKPEKQFLFSDPDKDSVMMYTFDSSLYLNGKNSSCYAPPAQSLSVRDIKYALWFHELKFSLSGLDLMKEVGPNEAFNADVLSKNAIERINKKTANASPSTLEKVQALLEDKSAFKYFP